jgi:hypothetical protein
MLMFLTEGQEEEEEKEACMLWNNIF